jgi:pyruvate dehydrogenase (quinone)
VPIVSRTVAEELVECLAQASVQRIHGLVGDSLNPVTDALHRSGKIEWV